MAYLWYVPPASVPKAAALPARLRLRLLGLTVPRAAARLRRSKKVLTESRWAGCLFWVSAFLFLAQNWTRPVPHFDLQNFDSISAGRRFVAENERTIKTRSG